MGLREDAKQKDLERSAGNTLSLVDDLKNQIASDTISRDALQAKIQADTANNIFDENDLRECSACINRINACTSKLALVKSDLQIIKDQIINTDYKAELETEISNL